MGRYVKSCVNLESVGEGRLKAGQEAVVFAVDEVSDCRGYVIWVAALARIQPHAALAKSSRLP